MIVADTDVLIGTSAEQVRTTREHGADEGAESEDDERRAQRRRLARSRTAGEQVHLPTDALAFLVEATIVEIYSRQWICFGESRAIQRSWEAGRASEGCA